MLIKKDYPHKFKKDQMQKLLYPILPAVVVSIHDVCPSAQAATEQILEDLFAIGVTTTSLLVIPNRHGADPAFSDVNFCNWLKTCMNNGHEAVLHGYFHQRMAEHESKGMERMIATQYTAGEGEFFDLTPALAKDLLERGYREMRAALGEAPRGFIAPAWLLGAGAEDALQNFTFDYTTRISGIWDLRGIHSEKCKADAGFYPSQSLCYSVRAPWRRWCSLGWNSLLLAWLDAQPLIRIGIHPPDWQFPNIRAHALQCIKSSLAHRPAMTYISWLDQQRRISLS